MAAALVEMVQGAPSDGDATAAARYEWGSLLELPVSSERVTPS
jgi:hypothetical protein